MAKGKKGALYQIFVPMVDATDFASIESAITESDFNSGVTKKFYGMNHGVSTAMTSGTISKAGSLVHSGIFRITLKGTENNYDVMMARFAKTGCADRLFIWENVDNDDSDLMSYLVALSAILSDAHSAAILGASTASLAQVQATAAASRALLVQSTTSNIYELTSDVQSYLVAMSGMLSDTHSAAILGASHASDAHSAILRHDANMVMRRNAVAGGAAGTITLDAGAAATNSLYNDMTIAVIAGTGAGQVRAIQNYVGATKIATISPNWETTPVAGDSFVLLTNRTDHSHLEDTYSLLSQLNSYVVVMSGMLSDTHSAAILGASTASLAQVQATAAASRALLVQSTVSNIFELTSDVQSYLVAMSGMLSDTHSAAILGASTASLAQVQATAAASRALLVQSTTSNIYELTSDVQSYLVGLSDLISNIQSALSDAHSDIKSGLGAISVAISPSDISKIASQAAAAVTPITASDISNIGVAVWANATGARVDSRVKLIQSNVSDTYELVSDVQSYLVQMSAMLSDTHSAAILGASHASNAHSYLVALSGTVSDIQSYLVGMSGMLSDTHSAAILAASNASEAQSHAVMAASRALVIQSTVSNIYELTSDVQSYLVRLSDAISDAHSDLASRVGAITAGIDASDIADIASAVWAQAGADVTGAISATASFGSKLDWVTALARNKVTQDASVQTLHDDSGSAVASAAVSDDGTTFTRDKWA